MIDYIEKKKVFRLAEFKSYLTFREKSINLSKLEKMEGKEEEG